MQKMNEKYPCGIGPAGRWLIFSGFPFSICAILLALTLRDGQIRGVSEKALPYVIVGAVSLIFIAGMILYGCIAKWLARLIGIIGWMVSGFILCWFFWFGPGSFGYSG